MFLALQVQVSVDLLWPMITSIEISQFKCHGPKCNIFCPKERRRREWLISISDRCDISSSLRSGGKMACVSDGGGNAGQRKTLSCETATTAATRTHKHSAVPCHYSIIQHSLSGLQGIPCEHITVSVRASRPIRLKERGKCYCSELFLLYVTLGRWGIFVAIANNTLYGSKLSIFLLCQKSLGY